VNGFLDSDSAKHDHCIDGVRIESPARIFEAAWRDTMPVVVVASIHWEAILAELERAAHPTERVVVMPSRTDATS
jgi:hypothetical protein